MFDFITNPIENALDVLGDLVEGEVPSKRQVAQLIADGVSIYAIAEATGFAVDTIKEIAGEE